MPENAGRYISIASMHYIIKISVTIQRGSWISTTIALQSQTTFL